MRTGLVINLAAIAAAVPAAFAGLAALMGLTITLVVAPTLALSASFASFNFVLTF